MFLYVLVGDIKEKFNNTHTLTEFNPSLRFTSTPELVRTPLYTGELQE